MADQNATTHPLPSQVETAWAETARYYRTDSRISGVRTQLPQSVRVEHIPHDEFSGIATLEYDNQRRDHVLKKVETVPGIREVFPRTFSVVCKHTYGHYDSK